ncbi:hypothetical protein [Pseudonocardia sp. H11422]|uniref:hypothetical protein n=1 Tax=Pseudonocardia sp. H11422 TaxID=2835866 RepID=UPI001BDD1792|nr:hypothetical protein [Pseudonocardia sp. H11422]
MLLLVLILVLIAFGLLVVALLSGSVLWAWVSVAVSVGAAAVLLVDWLQRRAAVRAAGSDTGLAADTPAPPVADIEPVTEVIPVIPASAPVPGAPSGPAGGAPVPPPAPADPRFDLTGGSQETVVMPVVQPSGSAERPSGAAGDISPSGDISSPSVTESGAVFSPGSVDAPDVPEGGRNASEEAPAVSGPTGTAPGIEPAAPGQAGQPAPPEGSAAPVHPSDTGGTPAAAPAGAGTADAAVPPEPGESAHAGADGERPTASGVPQAAVGDASGIDGPTVAVAAAGIPAVAGTHPPTVPPAGEPGRPDAPEGEVFAGSRAERPGWEQQDPRGVQQDPRAAAVPPPVPNAEPPEEQRDAAAAALVAGLNDEVVVIDELPRYHVPGCRSLPGRPIIPLPVREAVELGFTPCGWCTPDRVLSSRHPAAAR